MKQTTIMMLTLAVLVTTAHLAHAEVLQVVDSEPPSLAVETSAQDGGADLWGGNNALTFTLFATHRYYKLGPRFGLEYTRRIAPHLDLGVGFNMGWKELVPSATVRVRAFERGAWSPYVFGRVAQVMHPGLSDMQMLGGGAGIEWRKGDHGVVFVQAGVSAARNLDRDPEDGVGFDGEWRSEPDMVIGYGARF